MKKLTVLVTFVLGVTCLSVSLARAEPVPVEQVAVDEPAAQTDTSPPQECDEAAPADNLLAKWSISQMMSGLIFHVSSTHWPDSFSQPGR